MDDDSKLRERVLSAYAAFNEKFPDKPPFYMFANIWKDGYRAGKALGFVEATTKTSEYEDHGPEAA